LRKGNPLANIKSFAKILFECVSSGKVCDIFDGRILMDIDIGNNAALYKFSSFEEVALFIWREGKVSDLKP